MKLQFRAVKENRPTIYSVNSKGKPILGWFFSNIDETYTVQQMWPGSGDDEPLYEGDAVTYKTVGSLDNTLSGHIYTTELGDWVVWDGKTLPRHLRDVYALELAKEDE